MESVSSSRFSVYAYKAKTILLEGYQKGESAGYNKDVIVGEGKGEIKKARRTANNLFRMNMPIEQIAEAVEVDVVLRFVKKVDVIDSFYELLKDSEIVKKPNDWYALFRRRQVVASLIEHNRQDYLYPPEIRQETIRREHRKIGVNEPCPCGSGKKFKKSCPKRH